MALTYWIDGLPAGPGLKTTLGLDYWVDGASLPLAFSGVVSGEAAASLTVVTAAGDSGHGVAGEAAGALGLLGASGEGYEIVLGSGAPVRPPLTAAGLAYYGPIVLGDGHPLLFPGYLDLPEPLAQSPLVDWPSYDLVPQPDHAWYFNNNFQDTPAPGKTPLHLSPSGSLSWGQDWAGRNQKAVVTPGSSYLSSNQTGDLNFGNAYALVLVFKTGENVTSYQELFSTESSISGISIYITEGKLKVYYRFGSEYLNWDFPFVNLNANSNYLVVVTQINGQCRIYANGILASSSYIPAPMAPYAAYFGIMGRSAAQALTAGWRLYGLMTFKGAILAPSQVQTLYDTWIEAGGLYKRHPDNPTIYQGPEAGRILAAGEGLTGNWALGGACPLPPLTAAGQGIGGGVAGQGAAVLTPAAASAAGNSWIFPQSLAHWEDGHPPAVFPGPTYKSLLYWAYGRPQLDLHLCLSAGFAFLSPLAAAISGETSVIVQGEAAAVTAPLTAVGLGYWSYPEVIVTGEIAASVTVTGSGAGIVVVAGAAAPVLAALSASGGAVGLVAGSGAPVIHLFADGSGCIVASGEGEAVLSPPFAEGSGVGLVAGEANAALPEIESAAAGCRGEEGGIAAQMAPLSGALTGIIAVRGSLEASLAAATASGAGLCAGAGDVILQPPGIPSGEEVGEPRFYDRILPTSIDSAEAFGTPAISYPQTISPSGVPSAEYVKAPFYLQPGPYVLGGTKIVGWDADTGYGIIDLSFLDELFLFPEGLASQEGVGQPAVGPWLRTVGIGSGEAWGNPAVLPQAAEVAPAGIISQEGVGAPAVRAVVQPGAIASQEALGQPEIEQVVRPVGIPSDETLGTPLLQPGAVAVQPGGIGSGEEVGTPLVEPRSTLQPAGIAPAEALGAPQLNAVVQVSGIGSGENCGYPVVNPGAAAIHPPGIASHESLGTPALSPVSAISPAGLASSEALGEPALSLEVLPGGLPSQEYFGIPALSPGAVEVQPEGVPSQEALGAPAVRPVISPAGLASGESCGAPWLSTGEVQIAPPGLASQEALGRVRVKPSGERADLIVLTAATLTPVEMAAGMADLVIEAEALEALGFTVGLAVVDLYVAELKAVANG